MNDEIGGDIKATAPVWATFDDLISVLLGALALILVGVIGVQLELFPKLESEVKQREAETQHRKTLEQALVGLLVTGRMTLVSGRIGVNDNILFVINSDQLQPEGRAPVESLAGPLAACLTSREEIPMVDGSSDDQQMRAGNRLPAGDWELPTKRALTVTRTLTDEGIPASNMFAVAFESQQPASSNTDDVGHAKNQHVGIAPTPRWAASNGGRREPH